MQVERYHGRRGAEPAAAATVLAAVPTRAARRAASDRCIGVRRPAPSWRYGYLIPPAGPRLDNAGATWHGIAQVTRPSEAQHLRELASMRRVRDRIDREYQQPLDVEGLARGVNMSAGHLSRQYRQAFGESPYAYLMTRRIERALKVREAAGVDTSLCRVVWSESDGLPGVVVDEKQIVSSTGALELKEVPKHLVVREWLGRPGGVKSRRRPRRYRDGMPAPAAARAPAVHAANAARPRGRPQGGDAGRSNAIMARRADNHAHSPAPSRSRRGETSLPP